MRDDEIIRLLCERPEEGMQAVMETYGRNVEWMVLQVLGRQRRQDAEECVSDVYVKLWQNADDFEEKKGSLLTWIYSIARNTAIDRLRRIAGRDTVPWPEYDGTETLGVVPDFSDEMVRKENAALIRETVHAMKQPDRTIFLLRYYYFLTVKEIADRLQMTPKQVENRLLRGRKKLKETLMKKGVALE